jgi:hypothetical protein
MHGVGTQTQKICINVKSATLLCFLEIVWCEEGQR